VLVCRVLAPTTEGPFAEEGPGIVGERIIERAISGLKIGVPGAVSWGSGIDPDVSCPVAGGHRAVAIEQADPKLIDHEDGIEEDRSRQGNEVTIVEMRVVVPMFAAMVSPSASVVTGEFVDPLPPENPASPLMVTQSAKVTAWGLRVAQRKRERTRMAFMLGYAHFQYAPARNPPELGYPLPFTVRRKPTTELARNRGVRDP